MKQYQTGLQHHQPDKTMPGFTVIAPMRHKHCYVVDMAGAVVHTWSLPGLLGSKGYLLPNGNFLCSVLTLDDKPIPGAIGIPGALGGRILELDWEGNIVWEHLDPNQHHDVVRLDNGNTLYLAREEMPANIASKVTGGIPGTGLLIPELKGKMIGDVVREVNATGELVWEWCFKDTDLAAFTIAPDCHRGEWAHINSLEPTGDGDILVSFRHIDTIAIIDRSTKNIVWSKTDLSWGHQHNAQILPNGHLLLFANGMNNLHQPLHSRVLELDLESDETVWEFIDSQRWTFFSPVMGGVQRMDNGNSLICEAINGRVFEVTVDGEIVWDYVTPMTYPNAVLRGDSNALFRAYRYAADSDQIRNRL